MDFEKLAKEALRMRNFSYVPYSKFCVGAALLTNENEIYTGCNIENAAYTPSNCAERTAIFKAVSEGKRDFKAIAIAGGKKGDIKLDYCSLCGVCRQVLMEFCDYDTFDVILVKSETEYKVYKLKELLPLGFGPKDLEEK